jgi:beta-N-acetylhexosaminidase
VAERHLGPLMVDLAGLELTLEDRDVLKHPLVGGVILFTRNYRDHDQLRRLCKDLLTLRRPRLLLAVDHEGGRVQRFRPGFTAIPPMRELGRQIETDPAGARAAARLQGLTIGRELAAFGFDLPFAPVLDRDCGVSTIIGNRAFSSDCAHIVSLARAFNAGLHEAGLSATGKHFPGHGAVAADSHLELPIDERPLAELRRTELKPFAAMIKAGLESVMMAHVRYTQVDELPASLSKIWIRDILRKRMGFRGAVFCDDLSMNGAAVVGGYEARARLALEAGCDMLPVCNHRAGVLELLDTLRDVRPTKTISDRLKKLYRKE